MRARLLVCLLLLVLPSIARAWDARGHEIVVELAWRLLPESMPAWVRADEGRARVCYMSADPDRWRNVKTKPMGHINKPDHYLDFELLKPFELSAGNLPPLRYDYVKQMAAYKATHPERDFKYDRSRDREADHEWPGFLPYKITEEYMRLKSAFSTAKTYERYAKRCRPDELRFARENALNIMGILSHYVADGSQPLHTTVSYNGWVGPNPNGYTTSKYFHRHIDGTFIEEADLTSDKLKGCLPKFAPIREDGLFAQVIDYLLETFAQVEPIYQLEKRKAFQAGSETYQEGEAFISERLTASAMFLAQLYECAYRGAHIDPYLAGQLENRGQPGFPDED